MKYFRFKETVTLWGIEYKKDQELEIRVDGGVWDTDGSWLFDYDGRNAEKYGFVIDK